MGTPWLIEAEISPGIRRVVRGGRAAWFLTDGSALAEAAAGGAPGAEVAEALDDTGSPVPGVVVPRMPGGLLEVVLRRHGGLTSAQTIGVLLACCDALSVAPVAPEGRIRMHRSAFAQDAEGEVRLIPCVTVSEGEADPQRELGELAYLCLTGRTWEETGIPVRDLRPAPADALAAIVIDLLESACPGPLDAHGLPAALGVRLALAGEAAPVPFIPSEPEVPLGDAVTARIRLDAGFTDRLAAGAGRGDGSPRGDRDDAPARMRRTTGAVRSRGGARRREMRQQERSSPRIDGAVGRLRSALRGGTESARTAQGRGAGARSWSETARTLARRMPRRVVAAGLAVSAVILGVALLASAQREADPRVDAASSESPPATTDAPARTNPPATTNSPTDPAAGLTDDEDPAGAFRALTDAREQAYETGDAQALEALTVPGSPAAAADAPVDLDAFAGREVRIEVEPIGAPEIAGTEAVLTVRMTTTVERSGGPPEDYGTQRIRVVLRFGERGWQVYAIHPG
ncbi:hypothetical protein [Brevibacterium ihuae]|uniref:hypothetical protein n=1 Tax=Brevibacterium ihuae TaxID=1631743 RepID=UPI000C78E157|nr:hypothetical protein [Brevibacterium ihuae]